VFDATLNAPRVDLDAQSNSTVSGDGQRLGATHSAESTGHGDRAGKRWQT
jgi:hypothetical protein